MAKTKTFPWDPAEHLETEEDMAAYLEAMLEDGDPALVAAALSDIARSQMLSRMRNGLLLGGPPYSKREEIYDRARKA